MEKKLETCLGFAIHRAIQSFSVAPVSGLKATSVTLTIVDQLTPVTYLLSGSDVENLRDYLTGLIDRAEKDSISQ